MSLTKFRPFKPVRREFPSAVGHVLPPEDPQGKHLLGSKLRTKLRRKVTTDGLGTIVNIPTLHLVVHHNPLFHTTGMSGTGASASSSMALNYFPSAMRSSKLGAL